MAYAKPERQVVVAIEMPDGCSVFDAIAASGIKKLFPELEDGQHTVGVFGKVVSDPVSRRLKAGERVEFYRPLLIDPKVQRLARARKA